MSKLRLGRFQKAMYEFFSLYPGWHTVDLRYEYNRRIAASLVHKGLLEQHVTHADMFRLAEVK